MDVKQQKEITYTLNLNEKEARWLKGLMQNPIFDESPEDEPANKRAMRKVFWEGLDIAGVETS